MIKILQKKKSTDFNIAGNYRKPSLLYLIPVLTQSKSSPTPSTVIQIPYYVSDDILLCIVVDFVLIEINLDLTFSLTIIFCPVSVEGGRFILNLSRVHIPFMNARILLSD